MEPVPRVLILGGGYAGLMAALRLAPAARTGRLRVELMEPRPDFGDRIRLHQALLGRAPQRRACAELLRGTGVTLLPGRAEAWDPARRTVRAALPDGPRELAYDRLVLALGSRTAAPVPGTDAHAVRPDAPGGAEAFRARLAALGAGGRVLVAGGGLSALETAAELAEARRDLRVALAFRGELAPGLSGRARAHAEAALARLRVALHPGCGVAGFGAGLAQLENGRALPFDLCAWFGGFEAPALAREAGLPVGPDGRLEVGPDLRCPAAPEVYGAGDAARVPGVPQGCKTALPLGAHAARNLLADLEGRPLAPFAWADRLTCVSLGRRDGLAQFQGGRGRPTGRLLTGRAGAFVKELICRGVAWTLRLERLKPGVYTWPAA